MEKTSSVEGNQTNENAVMAQNKLDQPDIEVG